MAVYGIVLFGDPILKSQAKPIKKINENIIKLLDNLRDTMYANQGVGLAAPQIGVPKRAIVIDAGEGLIELINPEIIEAEGEEAKMEGCLSAPGLNGMVKRNTRVVVKGLNRKGEEVTYEGTGLLARAFQHEIDHLNGILFTDRADWVARERSK